MNLPFFIAKKYFLSRKKRSFINFISLISMLGVAVGLSALIIILSVFNGLEDLNRQIFKSFDPDLKISPITSKSFSPSPGFIDSLRRLDDIDFITEVYQDKALAKNGEFQTIVDIKGVDSTFSYSQEFQKALLAGQMKVHVNGEPAAYVGIEVYNKLQLDILDFISPIEVLYPKNQKLNLLNPESNINREYLVVSGVFALEQNYDNTMYIPLETIEDLAGIDGSRTAIEINLKPNAKLGRVKKQINQMIENSLVVKDRDEQNESLLKAIKLEKVFIFIGLIFVVGIAAFNIFYALSMLVLDKRDDIETLAGIGAEKSLIRKIFITEGFIISGVGVLAGLIIGLTVVLIQKNFGVVGLGIDFAVTDAYPVRIMLSDILYSVFGIFIITFLASLIPAYKAVGFMTHNNNQ